MNLRRTKFLLINGMVFILLLSCQSTPSVSKIEVTSYDGLIEYMNWYINKEMKDNKVAGLSIALVDNNHVLWSKGFGSANLTEKIDSKAETIYGAASISKLFTATAIMQLEEQNLINLDAPITTYIPEFSILSRFEDQEEITVRMLMTHHSGLPTDKQFEWFGETEWVFQDTIRYFQTQYTAYKPNTILTYSNLAVDMLGIIIERVSGESFIDYMDIHVLKPLEMTTASFKTITLRNDVDSELISQGHVTGEKKSTREPFLGVSPSGSINGSVLDLSRFMMMVLNKGKIDLEMCRVILYYEISKNMPGTCKGILQ